MKTGFVSLAGAGPGDMGLVTLRTLERIQTADVIIYDRLVNRRLLHYARSECRMIYLGKENTEGGMIQKRINQTLIQYAKEGCRIVRLKGGDPFVFGRGAEEALALKENGIPFEIIHGVSAGIAVPGYAGIPVTHRDFASSLHLFTGHSKENGVLPDCKTIARLEGTLVFYMGVKNLSILTEELVREGKDPQTPAAVIMHGTTSGQKTVTGTLQTISSLAVAENIEPPSIIVIGDCVRLRNELDWLDYRPLNGLKILVTRDQRSASVFSEQLESLGAEAAESPFIEIVPLKVDLQKSRLDTADILLFNSANAVRCFFDNLTDVRTLHRHRIGVIGEATRLAMMQYKIIPDLMPEKFTVMELLEETVRRFGKGKNILFITSTLSPVNCEELSKKYESTIHKLEVYQTIQLQKSKEELEELADAGIDIITFMSSSTVESFFENIRNLRPRFENIRYASIGPETSKTLRRFGIEPDYEAEVYTREGMIESILKKEKRGSHV